MDCGRGFIFAFGELLSFTSERKQPKNAARNQGFWKSPKRRQWRIKRGGFEEVSRLAATKWTESAGTTVYILSASRTLGSCYNMYHTFVKFYKGP